MKALAVAFLSWACLSGAPAAGAERPVLAVLDFSGSEVSPGELALFGDFLTSHIVQTGRFTVVDRMQRQALLEEIEFSHSDGAEESRRLEIGRLLAAASVVSGSLGRFGGRFLVNVELIEVETGGTANAVARTYDTLDELLEDSRSLALQLLGLQAAGQAPAETAARQSPAAIPERTIRVDGDTADWDGLGQVFRDPVGDHGQRVAGADIEEVYLARDKEKLYVRFALTAPGLPGRPRAYMQALVAVNLLNGDYLLLAAFYKDGWRAAVHTWNPRTGKSAPLAFGAMARTRAGFEASFPIAALRGHLQEGRAYATSAKTGAAVGGRYRDLDTVGPRFLLY